MSIRMFRVASELPTTPKYSLLRIEFMALAFFGLAWVVADVADRGWHPDSYWRYGPFVLFAIVSILYWCFQLKSLVYTNICIRGTDVEFGRGKRVLDRCQGSEVHVFLPAQRRPFQSLSPIATLPNGVQVPLKNLTQNLALTVRALKSAGADIEIEEIPREEQVAIARREVALAGWVALVSGVVVAVSFSRFYGQNLTWPEARPWMVCSLISIFIFVGGGLLWLVDRIKQAKGTFETALPQITSDQIAPLRGRTEMELGRWYRVRNLEYLRTQYRFLQWFMTGPSAIFVVSLVLSDLLGRSKEPYWPITIPLILIATLGHVYMKGFLERLKHRFVLESDHLVVDFGGGMLKKYPEPAKRTTSTRAGTFGTYTDRYGPFWGGYRLDPFYLELDEPTESSPTEEPTSGSASHNPPR